MGSVLSRAKLILGAVVLINRALDTLSKRFKASPGLPVSNPSLPFWTIPKSTISSEGRALPEDADIVIIGSGITGTSFAYHALKRDSSLRVVILEARDVCSGATGRNGGHINPPLFDGWKDLKERHGESDAKMLIRFRLAHVQDLKAVATEEHILKESQIRVTEHLEVHINREYFEEAREELEGWKADMPDEAEAFAAFEESQVVEDGLRSFVFHPGGLGYDYLTQLPSGEHELMFGGGWASAFDSAFADIGVSDDSSFSLSVASHLAGALPLYFGTGSWGKEKQPDTSDDDGGIKWGEGRTKAQWGGILGISADGLPWVGRLPRKISGRAEPPTTCTSRERSGSSGKTETETSTSDSLDDVVVRDRLRTASPGEWIAAGYTGEGMVHAWMSGKALACMVQDAEDEMKDWFPEMLRVTEDRWKKANLEEFISRRL
ncbi:hypothetical protein EW026_g3279 [Hermanssonia centrifuga]|uniref:FAD dependent oxidoreductase domain-containing protein n=1 Tax=Hermanssonia centrifuga TaxID=98765 RepID=A0A4S4KL74_9APHY|nr:hypothetical protein EW026_g3279 [Hermanssonia centrifuga]